MWENNHRGICPRSPSWEVGGGFFNGDLAQSDSKVNVCLLEHVSYEVQSGDGWRL